jgi:antitoxin HicB
MQYAAKITTEGKHWLIEFPDCPGCQTFGTSREDALAQGREALQGWLEAHLIDGALPPKPKAKRGVFVTVPLSLAVALDIRWLREEQGLSQGALAKRMAVSQQQVAKLERPGGNPSVETLTKVARALGREPVLAFEFAR